MMRSMVFCPTRVHLPTLRERQVKWWITVTSLDQGTEIVYGLKSRLTNFALTVLLSTKGHTPMTVWHEASAEETSPETFARLHGLHGQVCPHRLRYGIKVLAGFQALLCKSLDFGASTPRLASVTRCTCMTSSSPVLEPNLNRPFSHVNFVRNALPDVRSGRRVLVEFHLQGVELILSGTLSLLILLLLCQGALPGRPFRCRVGIVRSRSGRGWGLKASRVAARDGGLCTWRAGTFGLARC